LHGDDVAVELWPTRHRPASNPTPAHANGFCLPPPINVTVIAYRGASRQDVFRIPNANDAPTLAHHGAPALPLAFAQHVVNRAGDRRNNVPPRLLAPAQKIPWDTPLR
jgi:hypothetical protein